MKKVLYLDQRSMALGRVLLAIMVLWDILRTFPVLKTFFTDEGIISRSEYLGYSLQFGSFSYLLINGSYAFAFSLLLLGSVASIFLMFGIRTRVSLFVCWSILVSFQERFVHLYNGGDALLLILLFWSFFLPINAKGSWDSSFDESPSRENRFLSFFTFAFILQVCFVYIFSAINKWHPVWLEEGTALYYVSELESYLKFFGPYLKNFPTIMTWISKGTLWFEGVFPLFLFIPFFIPQFRLLTILSFLTFHLGIELTLEVGNFSFIAIAMWSFLLPTEFWDFLSKKMSRKLPKETLIVTYDKDCGFCKRMVTTICSWLNVINVKIQSSENDPILHKQMMEVFSWAGTKGDKETYFGWRNFQELLKYSPLRPVAFILGLIPLYVGELIYQSVAKNRKAASHLIFGIGSSPVTKKTKKLTLIIGIFFLFLCLGFNLDRLDKVDVDVLGKDLEKTAVFFRISQRWGMFAPRPSTHEGWIVIEAELINGEKFDLWKRGPLSYERPENLAKFYPHPFWRKYITNIEEEGRLSKILRDQYGAFLCRTYNKDKPRGGNQLRFIDFYFFQENSPKPGWPRDDARRRRLFSVDCPLSRASKD